MEISNELFESLKNCSWLENCGSEQQCSYNFDVQFINKVEEVTKYVESTTWENICLDERGALTGFLAKNHKNEYNRFWNKEVRLIKKDYLPLISEKINSRLKEKNMPEGLLDDIKFNLLSILMAKFYSDYYTNKFFDNILEVYLSGRLPCGWTGKYPDGKLLVY